MSPQALTQAAHALRPSHVTLGDSHVINNDTPESTDPEYEEREMSRTDILKLLRRRRQKSPFTKTMTPINKPSPKKPRLALRSEFLESDSDLSPQGCVVASGSAMKGKKKKKRTKLLFGADSDEEGSGMDEMENKEDGEMEVGEVERREEASDDCEEDEDEHRLIIVE